MRTREEIENNDIVLDIKGSDTKQIGKSREDIILEILLDIRDLLTPLHKER